MMIRSLIDVVTASKDAHFHTPRADWVLKWPGQVVLCVSRIYWTQGVHRALSSANGLSYFLEKSNVCVQISSVI
jgi:dynein heavy chain